MKSIIKLITFTGLLSVCFGFTLPRSVLVRLCETGQFAQESGLDQVQVMKRIMDGIKSYLKSSEPRKYGQVGYSGDYDNNDDYDDYGDYSSYSSYSSSGSTSMVNNGMWQSYNDISVVLNMDPSVNMANSMGSLTNALNNLANLGKGNSTTPTLGSLSESLPSLPTLPNNIFDGLAASLANSTFPSILPNEIFGKPAAQSTTDQPETTTGQPESTTDQPEIATGQSESIQSTLPPQVEDEIAATIDNNFCQQIDYPEQLDFNNPDEVRKASLRVLISKLKLNQKQFKSFENIVSNYQDKLFN